MGKLIQEYRKERAEIVKKYEALVKSRMRGFKNASLNEKFYVCEGIVELQEDFLRETRALVKKYDELRTKK